MSSSRCGDRSLDETSGSPVDGRGRKFNPRPALRAWDRRRRGPGLRRSVGSSHCDHRGPTATSPLPANSIAIRARRCPPGFGWRAMVGGWKCSGGRSCFDRSLNPTATSALPARLSVRSASRMNHFRWRSGKGGKCSGTRSRAASASGRHSQNRRRCCCSAIWTQCEGRGKGNAFGGLGTRDLSEMLLLDEMIAALDRIGHS
jgi:hypothetical protein